MLLTFGAWGACLQVCQAQVLMLQLLRLWLPISLLLLIVAIVSLPGMIFRKEPFFYGHDNYDQLAKIAKVPALLDSK